MTIELVRMASCSPGAIKSFPLDLAITVTDTLYDSVDEPVTMDIQWATRSTPPMFITPMTNCITDEVGAGNTNLTTLRFMNNNYTISAVQIITASHKNWILPNSLQSSNFEDIVITFSTTSATTPYNYLTFVIPILRFAGASDPSYLKGLSDRNSNGPFSLQSCFPTDPRARFARYVTCLAGYSSGAPTQNVYIFVSTSGIQANQATMLKILETTGRSDKFGIYNTPFTNRLTGGSGSGASGAQPGSRPGFIQNIADFSNKVQTTTQLLNYAGFKALYPSVDTNIRQDDTSAYQCVPIDPDSAIVDGKINVDLKSGEVLSDVLDKRNHLRSANAVSAGMSPGRVEKYLGTALGIVLLIILFFTLPWLVMVISTGNNNEENAYAGLTYNILIALIMGFVGFIIGAMLN